MPTIEQELRRFDPVIKRLCRISLFGKDIQVKGEENLVREGPNIIVGNHCGSFKDVATVFRMAPRPVFFTANKQIFNKQEFNALIHKHLKIHLRDFGLTIYRLITPLRAYFVNYISTNIGKIGTIPVNLNVNEKKGEAMNLCEDLVRSGRALIALQGRGRVKPKAPHPYVDTFRRGASFIAYDLFHRHRLKVPVTPVAFLGTQAPFLVPGTIRVNVGGPMYITDYLVKEVIESVERFREALEARVKSLFLELVRAD